MRIRDIGSKTPVWLVCNFRRF